MRFDAVIIAAKPFTGATKTTDHLIGNQQNAVVTADALNFRPVGAGGNDDAAGTLHWFTNKGGHVFHTDFEDFFLQFTCRFNTVLFRQ